MCSEVLAGADLRASGVDAERRSKENLFHATSVPAAITPGKVLNCESSGAVAALLDPKSAHFQDEIRY